MFEQINGGLGLGFQVEVIFYTFPFVADFRQERADHAEAREISLWSPKEWKERVNRVRFKNNKRP